MRIVSLQPSISIVLDSLGGIDQIVACTKYCVDAVPVLAHLPVHVIHDSWSASTDQILAAKPDLVLASVPYRMESLAAILKAGVAVLTLAPHTLADIYADIALIGSIVRRGDAADTVIASMQQELDRIRLRAPVADKRPLVYCEEWGKPLIHSQAWVDELVALAGGRTFANPGAVTEKETVKLADPDVLLFPWCGAGDRVPLRKIVTQRGWTEMRAVREGRVYCIPDEWLNTPAPTLVKGARAIAATLHPEIFRELELPIALPAS